MRFFTTIVCLMSALFVFQTNAQSPRDFSVPITANVSLFPPTINLEWPNPGNANLQLLRRTKGQTGAQWIQLLNIPNSAQTSYTDNNVAMGQIYEYVLVRSTTLNAFGYAHVAVRGPVVDNRGKVLIIVDSTTADALGVELVRMKNDMRGDGWVVEPHKIGPAATVSSVKSLIVNSYNADPQNVRAVLLIGSVPVPYSGNTAWDGHDSGDIHTGAWPADSYYADVNGLWTDVTINNTTPTRDANDNVPGDGKFDQSFIPTQVELQVGRIDFRRIDAPAFGETDAIGLIRRYLDKNHAWRRGTYKVDQKAIVDDNFGFFGGQEPFALNGYRNAQPLVGNANVVDGDFFNNTNPQSYLMGYACGGGWYQGASGVGNSNNFATDTVNVVFADLFGSYFGDWDHESNPFMVAALASRGGILTCSWAGRPHHFYQALASGETIGYCMRETQNAPYNNGFYQTYGEGGAHITLLGDPTLRAHIIPPPKNVQATASCTRVRLDWNKPDENVDGYHIYRSLSNDGPYTRLTTNLVSDTVYFDNNPVADTMFYQVRAIRSTTAPGGGFYNNNSVGPITYLVFSPGTPPVVQASGGELTCQNASVALSAQVNTTVSYAWSGPDGFFSLDATPTVAVPGNYNLVVTDALGCTASATTFVAQNTIPPVATVITTGSLTCAETSALLSVTSSSALNPGGFTWSTGANTNTLEVTTPGTYTVTITDWVNGCTGTASIDQLQDITPPDLQFPSSASYNCLAPCVLIVLPLPTVYAYQLNLEPVTPGMDLILCNAGTYTITTTKRDNGCSTESTVVITADVNDPGAAIGGQTVLSCTTPSVQLQGSSLGNDVSFTWSGPGINAININQQNPTVNQTGVYTLTVTDLVNGCTSTDQITVTTDQNFAVAVAQGGLITCAQTVVQLSSAGSSDTPNTSYTWTGPGGFFSQDPNPTTTFPGTYTLIVDIGNGCTASATANVTADIAPPTVTVTSDGVLNCNQDCLELTWSGAANITVMPTEFCDPGTYTVTITNTANACTQTISFTIIEAPDLTAEFEPAFIDCDGTVTLTIAPSGGVPPYSYLWSNGSTLQSTLYLLNGTPITVTVTDASGCTWESDPLIIPTPTPLTISPTIVDESSPGAANGTISLVLSGGTPPFSYEWSNGATTKDISGLSGGVYSVTVTELTTGCTAVFTFTVNTSVGLEEIVWLKQLAIAPNPTVDWTNLTLQLSEEQVVKVEVHDMQGKMIHEFAAVQTDLLQVAIDMRQQPVGVYQIVVTAGGHTTARPFVVSR